ncbi:MULTISPECIES: DUF4126 family protein [Sorangium]|uniref:DUF4126 domain-containing protein n=1 Tax=Sorangium cellulosum TaxID=56 RepID=A0A4V0NG43_SORCE|nr:MULTISPECIES: DUF4126 family protein [Sorangium]AUX31872.1 uncharacterized protein SOCE836_040050 [Sorangium cellulosum]WCQ91247.1 hypothetical protein NQZ70_03962 [Sorangium sp. Soce836]
METTTVVGGARRSRTSEILLLGQAAGLGLVTGMRSMLGVRILAASARRGAFDGQRGSFWRALRSPVAQRALSVLAGGELLFDKLPSTPSRLAPGPLGARLVIGAVLGAAVGTQSPDKNMRVAGAVIGATAAAIGALAGNRARAWLDRGTRIPGPVAAAAEDAIAFGLGALAARR